MSKYDNYKASLTEKTNSKEIVRNIEVLFEDGDTDISGIMLAADLLLISEADLGGADITDALLDIPEEDFLDLLQSVWTTQMSTMGNGKFAYANRLRNRVNAAQRA